MGGYIAGYEAGDSYRQARRIIRPVNPCDRRAAAKFRQLLRSRNSRCVTRRSPFAVNAPGAILSRGERARRILALNIEILMHTAEINFHAYRIIFTKFQS